MKAMHPYLKAKQHSQMNNFSQFTQMNISSFDKLLQNLFAVNATEKSIINVLKHLSLLMNSQLEN